MDRARRAEPFGNAATYSREKSRQLINHFNRISHVQARVDSSKPKQRMARFTMSSVEQKILRLQEIEAENRRLLHKISTISTSGKGSQKTEFRWDKLRGQKKRLNEGVRRREHERIWKENQLILKRLQKCKPTMGRADWKASEKWNKNFLAGADRRRAMLRIKVPELMEKQTQGQGKKTKKVGAKKKAKAGRNRIAVAASTPTLRPMTQTSQRSSSKRTPGSRPTTTFGSRNLKPIEAEDDTTTTSTRSMIALPQLEPLEYEEEFEADSPPKPAMAAACGNRDGFLPQEDSSSDIFVVKTFNGTETTVPSASSRQEASCAEDFGDSPTKDAVVEAASSLQEPSYAEDFEGDSPTKENTLEAAMSLQEPSYAEDFESGESPTKDDRVQAATSLQEPSYAEDFEGDSPTKENVVEAASSLQEASYAEDFEGDDVSAEKSIQEASYAEDFDDDGPHDI